MTEISQVWLMQGDRALPVYGVPDSLSIKSRVVTVAFPDEPFIRAIARNYNFTFTDAFHLRRILVAKISTTGRGVLRHSGISKFIIERQTSDSGAIAFRRIEGGSIPLTVVDVGKELGRDEISVDSGGVVQTHLSQGGKTVSVMLDIVIPMTTALIQPVEPIPGNIKLNILGQDSSEADYLITFYDCHCKDFTPEADRVVLELTYRTVKEVRLDDSDAAD